MTDSDADTAAAVDRLLAAIEAGDVDAARAAYAPHARIWHNFDGLEQDVDENLRSLAWMVRRFAGRRYVDVRRVPFAGGLVQQHVLELTRADGAVVRMPAMLRLEVADGLVTRVEEYLDPAPARA